jgi:hypothetical protein
MNRYIFSVLYISHYNFHKNRCTLYKYIIKLKQCILNYVKTSYLLNEL